MKTLKQLIWKTTLLTTFVFAGNLNSYLNAATNQGIPDNPAETKSNNTGTRGTNIMLLQDASGFPSSILEINLEVINEDQFVGFQLDIPITDGFSYIPGSATPNPQRFNNHLLETDILPGTSLLRILSYSFINDYYLGNSGVLVSFLLQAPNETGVYLLELEDPIIGNISAQNILTNAVNGIVTIELPDSLVVTCPEDLHLGACTEENIQAAYLAWVSGFSYEGDINVTTNINDIPALPGNSYCEGVVLHFNFEAAGDFYQDECSSTFTVTAATLLTVYCPYDLVIQTCDENMIQDAYNAWVAGFTYVGGCNVNTNIEDIPVLPENVNCEGFMLEFTYYVESACDQHECTSTFTVTEVILVPDDLVLSNTIIQSGTDTCFAAIKSITTNGFIVQSGATASLIAGEKVILGVGTLVEHDGNLHVRITENEDYCVQIESILAKTSDQQVPVTLFEPHNDNPQVLNVYPNPTTGLVTFELSGFESDVKTTIEIYDMMGNKLMQVHGETLKKYVFDLSSAPGGLYLVKVINGGEIHISKVLKR